jgi:1-acyl-sn-glycerol-3-phosphate acyltransferase
MKQLITIYRWTLALSITFITGSISLVLVIISFGLLRNFCVKHIIKYSSRILLWSGGFNCIYPPIEAFPKHPVFYTFNHNSYLDVFILTGIGLPNVRFILSEKTLGYIPIVISALATGTFYIPQQKHPKRRLKFFIRLTNKLKKHTYSIAASSEGVHPHFHGIAPFNRGVYHMAMEAKLPIVPLYIHIPKESNMFKTDYAKKGTFKLEILDEVDNSTWTLDNLEDGISQARQVFIDRFNHHNPDTPQLE